MLQPFQQPRRRLARANKHIAELDAKIGAFLKSHPYTRFIETDSETGNETHKIKLTDPLPDEFSDQAIEIAEGLRAVLDGCGYAAALATGNRRLKGTYFPIADSAERLETDVIGRGRCRDLPPEIVALFRSFEPYQTRNHPVWAINQIANGTKHKVLNPIAMASSGGGFIKNFHCPGLCIEFGFPPSWDRDKDELTICIVGPNANPTYDMTFNVAVSLAPIAGIERIPVAIAFGGMARQVGLVLAQTEAETFRILKTRKS